MITKPDANPILYAVLNLFGMGGLGYFLMGQKKKAIISWILVVVGSTCTFGMGYLVVWVLAYDAYLLGQKLQQGESIGEVQNGLELLNVIFKE